VIANSSKPSDSVQQQVESLTALAKKLSGEGKEPQALEAYKQASGLMLGAPWLQHRTAELARKLKLPEVAALHYRRAAAAFIRAGFPKRALSPLRCALQLNVPRLPASASAFIALSVELATVQRQLGFSSDAKLTLSNANLALEASGSADRVPTAALLDPPRKAGSEPPDSGVVASVQSSPGKLFSQQESALKP